MLAESETRLKTLSRKLEVVQEISRALSSSLDLDTLLALIVERVTRLMDADRSTLFVMSDDGTMLWSRVLQGNAMVKIELKVGEGIAGHVGRSGETVNIVDAYDDPRFNPKVDQRSGYVTTSILCVPMRQSTGRIVGVLQLLNKKGGAFSESDEELLSAIASQAAMSIETSKLYQSMVDKNKALQNATVEIETRKRELDVLYQIERDIVEAEDLGALLETLLSKACSLTGAKHAMVATRVGDEGTLRVAICGDNTRAERTLAIGAGVLGSVSVRAGLSRSQSEAGLDCTADEACLGHTIESWLCLPLLGLRGPLGAIMVCNKESDGHSGEFGEADLQMLTLVSGQMARAISVLRVREERVEKDRLAAVGQMLAGIVHDLKTPMTIVSGYAQLMAETDSETVRREYSEEILGQFDMMTGMAQSVLAFARGDQEYFFQKIHLQQFFPKVKKQIEQAFDGKELLLVLELDYTGRAFFDEASILRVLHNLARNAEQAMAGKGTLTIASRTEHEIWILECYDEGPGVPADLQDTLFNLFASGKREGSGLGLAICRRICEDHGGAIEVESQAGGGACFRMRIPLPSS